jgi:hypothetical protein
MGLISSTSNNLVGETDINNNIRSSVPDIWTKEGMGINRIENRGIVHRSKNCCKCW